ncbi:MAG: RNA polymerase sigma factor [Clostridia bacterium]|nr:RNA polymerase sigma factor [Clostridia bacterium]
MDNTAEQYRRFLHGDNDAIAEIITVHRAGLELFLQTIVGDAQLAEELTQETFVKIFIKKPRFKPTASFKTWLYTIGKNEALRYLKKQKRSVPLSYDDAVLLPDDAPTVEEQYFADERKHAVHTVLGKLNPAYREILWLTYFEGLSNKECALMLGKNVHSIESLVSRARKALKDQLRKDGFLDENE